MLHACFASILCIYIIVGLLLATMVLVYTDLFYVFYVIMYNTRCMCIYIVLREQKQITAAAALFFIYYILYVHIYLYIL